MLNLAIMFQLVPYKEFFPDSPESMCVSKKGEQKFVKVVKIIENPEKSKQLPVPDDDDDADDGENYEGMFFFLVEISEPTINV